MFDAVCWQFAAQMTNQQDPQPSGPEFHVSWGLRLALDRSFVCPALVVVVPQLLERDLCTHTATATYPAALHRLTCDARTPLLSAVLLGHARFNDRRLQRPQRRLRGVRRRGLQEGGLAHIAQNPA